MVGPDHGPDHSRQAVVLSVCDRWSGLVAALVVGVGGWAEGMERTYAPTPGAPGCRASAGAECCGGYRARVASGARR